MNNPLLDRLFAAIDAMDTQAFLRCLDADATFRFGSASPVTGRAAVEEAVDGFFATIAGLKHALHKTIEDADTLVCVGDVTYTRHDASEITLPFANVFELSGGLISDYRIYADIGPLYAGR